MEGGKRYSSPGKKVCIKRLENLDSKKTGLKHSNRFDRSEGKRTFINGSYFEKKNPDCKGKAQQGTILLELSQFILMSPSLDRGKNPIQRPKNLLRSLQTSVFVQKKESWNIGSSGENILKYLP